MNERVGRRVEGSAVAARRRLPRRVGVIAALLGVVAAAFVAGSAAGTAVGGANATVAAGATGEVPIVLASAPEGLSGYNVSVAVADADVASVEGASYPEGFGMTSDPRLGDGVVRLKAVDVGRNVEPGATDVRLATVLVRGQSAGETELRVSVHGLDDDGGNPIDAEPRTATIQVGGDDGAGRSGGGGGVPSVLGGDAVSPMAVIVVGLVLVLGVRYLRSPCG